MDFATLSRGHSGKVASVGVAGPHFLSPFFQGEGRIGDHAIKLGQAIASIESRLSKGIPSNDVKVFNTVEVEVNAGDTGGGR